VNLGFLSKRVIRSDKSRPVSASGTAPRFWANFRAFLRTRTFALSLYICISMLCVAFAMASTKIVQVVDGGSAKYIYTFRTNPKEILKQYGIVLTAQDQYEFSNFKNNFATIDFYQAFPVKVSADNNVTSVMLAKGTVADALAKAGVNVGENDEVNEPLDLAVSPGTNIVVDRVEYKTVTQSTPISYQTVTTQTPLLRKSTSKVLIAGKDGETQTVYRQKFVNGTMASQEIVSQTAVSQPVTCQKEVGTAASTPVSTMLPSSGLSLNASGVPTGYSKLIQGAATGYSPTDGKYSATGKTMQVGYVAVNPNVIPYGSKLYIMSADGSFVYGYAIAVDTGGFATNGSGVTVDLYFNNNTETGWFGRRNVNIYVLP
jgi:uncharacterized protein YabE (DUF348 family)/3D (Asp-Asp-Asp) domain-containing protein